MAIADAALSAELHTAKTELHWLLASLPHTLSSLATTLSDSLSLLHTPPSTLPLSTPRAETLKGILTRAGTHITRADLTLKHAQLPARLTLPPAGLTLPQLVDVAHLIRASQPLCTLPAAPDPLAVLAQLRQLLHNVCTARERLRGSPRASRFPFAGAWAEEAAAVDVYVAEAAVVVEVHALEKVGEPQKVVASPFHFRERFAAAVGLGVGERRAEGGRVVEWRGARWRVGVEVRVESQDPCLMAVWAKLGGLAHVLGGVVGGVEGVMRAAEMI